MDNSMMARSSPFPPSADLVLASASPRRRFLLGLLGLPFDVIVADVDESPFDGEAPDAHASRLARTKALTVARRRPSAAVLGADTVVAHDGQILGKPGDPDAAVAMLRTLRGRTHRVLTGLVLVQSGQVVEQSVATTTVWMRPYTDAEIDRYVATGRPFDKAGGYAIQDADFRTVERIDGCYPNVVGLPLCEARRALVTIGLLGAEAGPVAPPGRACDLCVRARESDAPA
jgi:MAF protein